MAAQDTIVVIGVNLSLYGYCELCWILKQHAHAQQSSRSHSLNDRTRRMSNDAACISSAQVENTQIIIRNTDLLMQYDCKVEGTKKAIASEKEM
jgi:hypothetical protein